MFFWSNCGSPAIYRFTSVECYFPFVDNDFHCVLLKS